jgi:uncharacterized repeat protein (TIGR01451 family)
MDKKRVFKPVLKRMSHAVLVVAVSAFFAHTGNPTVAQTQPSGFVEVTKSVDNPLPDAPMQTIEFTIQATGIGDTTAGNVILQEILPPELSIPEGMAAFTSAGVYDPDSGEWRIGDLEPEQTEVMTLPAIVVADPQPPCIVNSVSASANDGVFITDRASASVRTPGIERCADLAVSVSPSDTLPRSCDRGGAVGYRFNVSNQGPDAATNVVLRVTQSSAFRLPGLAFSDPACSGLTCRWSALPPGESRSVTAQSSAFETSQPHTHSVSATVTTDDEDYRTDNNSGGSSQDIAVSNCQTVQGPQINAGASLGSDSGCFIATAAYGTPYDTRIDVLRQFRDDWLQRSAPGRAFIELYYRWSPPLAEYIAPRPRVAATVRASLAPLILALQHPRWTLAAAITVLALAAAWLRRRRSRPARVCRTAADT